MSEPTTIAPALTPEEWARESASLGTSQMLELTMTGLVVVDDDYYVGFTAMLDRPAAVVALANAARADDDPGKITRGDVQNLLEAAADTRDADDKGERWGMFGGAEWAELLAAKLAALLPPPAEAGA